VSVFWFARPLCRCWDCPFADVTEENLQVLLNSVGKNAQEKHAAEANWRKTFWSFLNHCFLLFDVKPAFGENFNRSRKEHSITARWCNWVTLSYFEMLAYPSFVAHVCGDSSWFRILMVTCWDWRIPFCAGRKHVLPYNFATFYLNIVVGLTICSVTWNRFPIKILSIISNASPVWICLPYKQRRW